MLRDSAPAPRAARKARTRKPKTSLGQTSLVQPSLVQLLLDLSELSEVLRQHLPVFRQRHGSFAVLQFVDRLFQLLFFLQQRALRRIVYLGGDLAQMDHCESPCDQSLAAFF